MGEGCGIGQCRSAAAAPMQPLAWELPYAVSTALKRQKKKKKKGERNKQKVFQRGCTIWNQNGMKIPFAWHPCHHLVWSLFFGYYFS